nr:uncharacterized protein LOC129380231 isoform X4 [Dermacentor andersoni]
MDRLTHAAGSICFILLSNLVNGDDFLEKMRKKHAKPALPFWAIITIILISSVFVTSCVMFWCFFYLRRRQALGMLQPSPCTTAPCAPITSGAMNHSQPEMRALLPDAITHSALPNPQQLPEHHPEVGFNINNKGIPLSQPSAAPMPLAPLESPPPYGN